MSSEFEKQFVGATAGTQPATEGEGEGVISQFAAAEGSQLNRAAGLEYHPDTGATTLRVRLFERPLPGATPTPKPNNPQVFEFPTLNQGAHAWRAYYAAKDDDLIETHGSGGGVG